MHYRNRSFDSGVFVPFPLNLQCHVSVIKGKWWADIELKAFVNHWCHSWNGSLGPKKDLSHGRVYLQGHVKTGASADYVRHTSTTSIQSVKFDNIITEWNIHCHAIITCQEIPLKQRLLDVFILTLSNECFYKRSHLLDLLFISTVLMNTGNKWKMQGFIFKTCKYNISAYHIIIHYVFAKCKDAIW